MAYQCADPRPFIPDTFHWVDVPGREFMCRAVAPMRPPATNEDLAIVTLDPLPGNVLNFTAVRGAIRDFLAEHNIASRAILPCHLGQAYVRFVHAYERDNLVRNSPLPCGNIQISFAKHNEGRNWRRVFFNDECWLMLLGFPEDYISERHIQNAISKFGKIILWEESSAYPGRILVRARVTNIQNVPQFIAYSDTMDMHGDSWTIQCEVVQHHQLGLDPPEEDPMPDELEMGDHVPYDFFGLGQPVIQQEQNDHHENGQQQQQNLGEEHQHGPHQGEVQMQQQINPWEPWQAWSAQFLAQQLAQPVQEGMQLDLNLPANMDPIEVIINPANPPAPNAFLNLNEFIEEIEELIPQQQAHQQGQQNPIPVVQNQVQIQEAPVPFAAGFPIPQIPDVIGEEFLLEQLGIPENAQEDEIQGFIQENQLPDNNQPALPVDPHMEQMIELEDEVGDQANQDVPHENDQSMQLEGQNIDHNQGMQLDG